MVSGFKDPDIYFKIQIYMDQKRRRNRSRSRGKESRRRRRYSSSPRYLFSQHSINPCSLVQLQSPGLDHVPLHQSTAEILAENPIAGQTPAEMTIASIDLRARGIAILTNDDGIARSILVPVSTQETMKVTSLRGMPPQILGGGAIQDIGGHRRSPKAQ